MPLKLWPTKKQFLNWSMPSKITFIGLYVGLLGFILTAISTIDSCFGPEPSTKSDIDTLQSLLLDGVTINRPRLDADYPLGYVLLHADLEQMCFIKREGIDLLNKNIIIDWKPARIVAISKTVIRIVMPGLKVPSISHKGKFTNFVGDNILDIKRLKGYKEPGIFTIEDVRLWTEVLISNEKSLVLLVGFRPK